MKEKIELLNCGLFNQKQTGVKGTILKYRLLNSQYSVDTKYSSLYTSLFLIKQTTIKQFNFLFHISSLNMKDRHLGRNIIYIMLSNYLSI